MTNIIPVMLGADLNCYNLARAFHEAYGVKSWCFGRYKMAPTCTIQPCRIWKRMRPSFRCCRILKRRIRMESCI